MEKHFRCDKRRPIMKILHLMPYSPEPTISGGTLRIHHLLKHLAMRHDVTVACFGDPGTSSLIGSAFQSKLEGVHVVPYPWVGRYRRLGQAYAHFTKFSFLQSIFISNEMQATINRLLDRRSFDVVQTEFCMMAAFRVGTDAVRILDAHNVEYDNFSRWAENARSWLRKYHYRRESRKLLHEELEAYRRQDAIFVTSERDRAILSASVPDVPKFLVPNGVDTSYFRPAQTPSEPYSLVFTGMMGYVPNYDGMLYFLDEIFPLIQRAIPEARIYIVGNKPPRVLLNRAAPNVVITGYVEDVRPYVWRSSVYVVPLRMGGGTRLKVMEAMAMKKPIVSTNIGCEGIDVKNGESVLIADRPEEFAASVVELLSNSALRGRLIEKSCELARSKYEWNVIGEQVERFIRKLTRPRPRFTLAGKEPAYER
jgi:glycosyltransferase involved in cell wall biosynthesis